MSMCSFSAAGASAGKNRQWIKRDHIGTMAPNQAQDVLKPLKSRELQARRRYANQRRYFVVNYAMCSLVLLCVSLSALLVGTEASPPSQGGGILTPPRLRFTPPASWRRYGGTSMDDSRYWSRRASRLQLLASSKSGQSPADQRPIRGRKNIDDEFINSRAVQYASSKKAVEEVPVTATSGMGFWPPWPFNHLSISGKSSADGGDEENNQHDSGLDFKKDAKLFWRYMSHRARVGARQIQQRKFVYCMFI